MTKSKLAAVGVIATAILLMAAQPKVTWSAPDWQATHAYTQGTWIKPAGSNFFEVAMDGGGTSLGAPPTWSALANSKTADGTKLSWIALPIENRVYCPNGATLPLGCTPSTTASATILYFTATVFVTAPSGSTLNFYGDGQSSVLTGGTVVTACTSCLVTLASIQLPVSAGSYARHTVRVQTVETGVITGSADTSFWVDYTPSATGCTVTLTFDDTLDTQWGYWPTDGSAKISTVDLLEKYGMKGTFYINTPRALGQLRGSATFAPGSGFMTPAMVMDIQNRGHEIGIHTLNHLHLPCLTAAQQHVEIGNDLLQALGMGYYINDVAYPFGSENPTTWQVDIDNRLTGGRVVLAGGRESVPPDNNNSIDAQSSITGLSLATLQGYVTACETAANAQPWVIINAHAIVPNGVSPAGHYPISANLIQDSGIYEQFLAWLQPRAANGTRVKTVREVQGGTWPPRASWPNLTNPPNSSCEEWSDNGTADCTQAAATIPNCFFAARQSSSDAVVTGSKDTVNFHDGVASWNINVASQTVGSYDLEVGGSGWPFYQPDPECPLAPVTPGTAYTISFWYQSDQAEQFHIFVFRSQTGTTVGTCGGQPGGVCTGSWSTLTMNSSNVLAASPGVWVQASYTIPASGTHSLTQDMPDATYIGWGMRATFVGTSNIKLDQFAKSP